MEGVNKSARKPGKQMSTVGLGAKKRLLHVSSSHADSDVIIDESQGRDMGSAGDLRFKTMSDYDSTHYHNRNNTTVINEREPA